MTDIKWIPDTRDIELTVVGGATEKALDAMKEFVTERGTRVLDSDFGTDHLALFEAPNVEQAVKHRVEELLDKYGANARVKVSINYQERKINLKLTILP